MKTSILAVAALSVLCAAGPARPQQTALTSVEAMSRSWASGLQVRGGGNHQLAKDTVAMMKAAAEADPGNSRIWTALGGAYLSLAASSSMPGGDMTQLFPAFTNAGLALDKALALNPNDAEALAGHGTVLIIQASTQNKPELIDKGVAELNRAVEIAPNRNVGHLNRAFSLLALPPGRLDRKAVEGDLTFLLRVADGSRAGDTLHVLLGDLYADSGKKDQARAQYRAITNPATPGGQNARLRLAALDQGSVPAADIARLRSSVGGNCLACHGK